MKIAFNTIAFRFNNTNLFTLINNVSNWGYDGIEIWEPHLLNIENTSELKACLIKGNVIPSCLISYVNPIKVISDEDYKLNFIRLLRKCKEIHCCNLRIFAGDKSSSDFVLNDLPILINSLNLVCEICHEYDINLLVETHHDTFADNTKSTLELFKLIDPNIFCLLDLANLLERSRNYLDAFEQLNKFTRHMHLKNVTITSASYENPFRNVMKTNEIELPNLQNGFIKYDSILEQVRLNNKLNWITLEWFGKEIEKTAINELKYLKNYL